LGLSFRKSLVAIAAGVFTAGAIVTIAAKTGIAINQYFGWLALVTVAIILLAAYLFFHIRNRKA